MPWWVVPNPWIILLVFLLLCAPAWYGLLKPAWFGLRQMLGTLDPLEEALGALKAALEEVFKDIKGLKESTDRERLIRIGTRGAGDWLEGRGEEVVRDAVLLLRDGTEVYREWEVRWAPRVDRLDTLPAHRAAEVIHGFWTWLRTDKVQAVVNAAGRRLGFSPAVLADREAQLKRLVDAHAPDLAHGFWYGLYGVLACQFLILEGAYLLDRPGVLRTVAALLALYNFVRLARFGWHLRPWWPLRQTLLEIAGMAGIPNLPRYAGRLLAAEGLGLATMFLLGVRFLALGEALQGSGHLLGWIHRALVLILTIPFKVLA